MVGPFSSLNYHESYKIISLLPVFAIPPASGFELNESCGGRSNLHIYQLQRLLLPTFGWDCRDVRECFVFCNWRFLQRKGIYNFESYNAILICRAKVQ
jgi:hypothetical protein